MTVSEKRYDSIIIGAGMGGLCAAARLTAAGQKVLVLEKSKYMGGRCSSRQRGDYTVTTGALMVPMAKHSTIREAFDLLNVPMNMVELTGKMLYRLPHGDYDQARSGGGLRGLIAFAFEEDHVGAQKLYDTFIDAMKSFPGDTVSTRDWLESQTDNENVIKLFQGFTAALMGSGLHEISGGEFFRFLSGSSRGSRFGMAANGNEEIMEALAAGIVSRGSTILRQRRCLEILIKNGKAIGVRIQSNEYGQEIFHSDNILSNLGPTQTIQLTGGRQNFDKDYLARLDAYPHEIPIFHVSFVLDKPLMEDFDGCMVFGNNTNLIYMEIPSLISPTVTPDGKFLHTAYGAPVDSTRVDLKAELENTIRELETNFPGRMDEAEFIIRARHSGFSPGQHRCAGRMMPVWTSIEGLYNVGDGVTSPGTIGTEGAASSAKEAARLILGGPAT